MDRIEFILVSLALISLIVERVFTQCRVSSLQKRLTDVEERITLIERELDAEPNNTDNTETKEVPRSMWGPIATPARRRDR